MVGDGKGGIAMDAHDLARMPPPVAPRLIKTLELLFAKALRKIIYDPAKGTLCSPVLLRERVHSPLTGITAHFSLYDASA